MKTSEKGSKTTWLRGRPGLARMRTGGATPGLQFSSVVRQSISGLGASRSMLWVRSALLADA